MFLLPLLAITASCQKAPELYVDKASVQLSPVAGNPSVAYFTVHGGEEATNLIQVSSPMAIRVEMHESKIDNGVARMNTVTAVPVAARGKVEFAPGGLHVMLWNINPAITPGKTLPLVFSFGNGTRIQVDTPVQAMGAAAH
ncbi:copper chaperone PCu(A)C [Sphingomonas flavalba]|uniref:copper chaperone PCu(A)C n=1 Tax=Sphingomonas flavalba TaxID=2559804 RepID=UPI0039E0E920